MILFVTFICFLASSCSARPNLNIVEINPQNVITVPPNCPDGQEWVNGACREIWSATVAPANLITVPPNCPPGQSFINGQCRDVWIKTLTDESNLSEIPPEDSESSPQNIVTVPPNCRPGQQWINGSCRDVWRGLTELSDSKLKNVIQVPTNCLSGQEFINGECRDVWRRLQIINDIKIGAEEDLNRNVISVPNQCPIGYKADSLGICRPVMEWRTYQ